MTDVWGANTFPVRKYNSRAFHLKVRRSSLFRFFRHFPQINVGGDSARILFMDHASRESRVALPPKGRLRQHESKIRVKSYDHLKFSRASVVQFRASRYVMRLNLTSEWKDYDHLNFSRASLFNSEHLHILCAKIRHPSEKLWPFVILLSFQCLISNVSIYYKPESDLRVKSYGHLNFSRASIVQFRASLHVIRLNRTSEFKVMPIWISRELPLFNFKRLDILCAWIGPASEMLCPFEFLESLRCSISSVSIYYGPE